MGEAPSCPWLRSPQRCEEGAGGADWRGGRARARARAGAVGGWAGQGAGEPGRGVCGLRGVRIVRRGPGGGSGGLGERVVGRALGEGAALGTGGRCPRFPRGQKLPRPARLGVPGLVVAALVCRRTRPAREWPCGPGRGTFPCGSASTGSVSKWGRGTERCHALWYSGGLCLYPCNARADAQFPF